LELVADEDDSVVGLTDRSPKLALYPIALNGGGAGLYSDPREFGARNANGNGDEAYVMGRRGRRGNVRFAYPAERLTASNADAVEMQEDELETIDLEAQHQRPQQTIRRSSSSRLSIDPWSLWSHFHTELSRLAAIRTTRLEDNSSHVTLAKQRNLASGNAIASIYNQDDFDFVLVLSVNEAYAFWARYLDFREEALCCGYEEEDETSTIATKEKSWEATKEDSLTPLSTGLRRRRTGNKSANGNVFPSSKIASTPSQQTPLFSSMNNNNNTKSPVPRSTMIRSSQKRTFQKSLFERAVDRFSPTRFSTGSPKSLSNSAANTPVRNTPETRGKDVYSTGGKLRRRWGNQDYDTNLLSTPNLTSPPIVSLKSRRLGSTVRGKWNKGASGGGKRTSSLRKKSLFESAERCGKRGREPLGVVRSVDEMTEEDQFFASPGIPRGVGEMMIAMFELFACLSRYSYTQILLSLLNQQSRKSQWIRSILGGIRYWHCSSKALATRQIRLCSTLLR
jgi:hypothetical protein